VKTGEEKGRVLSRPKMGYLSSEKCSMNCDDSKSKQSPHKPEGEVLKENNRSDDGLRETISTRSGETPLPGVVPTLHCQACRRRLTIN